MAKTYGNLRLGNFIVRRTLASIRYGTFSSLSSAIPNVTLSNVFFDKRQMATILPSGALAGEPTRPPRFGILKVLLTLISGVSIGATISKKMAQFLEENELFVPDDDDDDDDDDDED